MAAPPAPDRRGTGHNGQVTSQDQARIAARYPQRSTTDYLLGGLAALAVLGAVVLVIVTGVLRSNPPVAGMVRSFEVVSPTKVTAEIVVQRRDPGTPVECTLYAQAPSFEKVAEQAVRVAPGADTLTSVDVTLTTIKEATSVSLDRCRVTS